jgi:hypothetical protein
MFGLDQADTENISKDSPSIRISDVDRDLEKENHNKSSAKKNEHNPSWDDYIIDSILGQGAYGKVFKVFKKNNLTKNGDLTASSSQSVEPFTITSTKPKASGSNNFS